MTVEFSSSAVVEEDGKRSGTEKWVPRKDLEPELKHGLPEAHLRYMAGALSTRPQAPMI